MIMLKGTPRFDGLALCEGTFNLLSTAPTLTAKAAFVDNTTGKTHGWTEVRAGWSKETLRRLQELQESMENDLAAVHFIGNASSLNGSGGEGAPPGLGEHLRSDDAPQI
jgi:hypothetical protein